jgi:hypothetical protein
VEEIHLPSTNPRKPDEHPSVPLIYSWPMHSSAANHITSTLEISVFQIDDPDHPKLQHGFRGELVKKTAPISIWSIYDWRKDPLLVNQPGHLRNAEDSKTELVLGVRVIAPKPHLYESKIVDFDASAAMHATIPGPFSIPLAEQSQTVEFSGGYFQPETADDDVPGQIKRWSRMGQLWNPPIKRETSAPATTTVKPDAPEELMLPDLRGAFVEQIAYTLEWNFRPPEEMAGNTSIASVDTSAATSTEITPPTSPLAAATGDATPAGANLALEVVRAEKMPRINADGLWDWELVPDPPSILASEMDIYYPQLPFIVGTPLVAAAA